MATARQRAQRGQWDTGWEDVGNVQRRQAMQGQQLARDAAYRASRGTAVVTDGQTLSTIAQQNNIAPADLLAANPGMNTLKTGMVLNVPGNAPVGMPLGASVYQGHGIGGLPSNAALGTQGSTAPQNRGGSVSMWGNVTPGYNTQVKPNNPYTQPVNPYAQYQYKPPIQTGISNPRSPQNWAGVANVALASANYVPSNKTIAPAPPSGYAQPNMNESFLERNPEVRFVLQTLTNKITAGYTPTQRELDQLLAHKWITPVPTAQPSVSGGGGYSYKRYGGGGGGGGSTKAASQPQEKLPAYSTGQGGFGLVNWRI